MLNLQTLVLVLLGIAAGAGHAAGAIAARDSSLAVPGTDLAILPIVNYSERSEAHTLLPRLHHFLERAGIPHIPSDRLRPFLRQNRIRSRGWVGRSAAAAIGTETGVRYLLLGSWDVVRTEPNPEIGLSLRILDLETMNLVVSTSVGAAGSDFVGLLGRGQITDFSELADRVLGRAVSELFPLPQPGDKKPRKGCSRLALIPLDNYSDTPNAGQILTNVVLSGLIEAGYSVVEPGFVRELGLARGVANQGGIDHASAVAIQDAYEVCGVITGGVEEFSAAPGMSTTTVPSITFNLRVIDPRAGAVRLMQELEGDGDDYELFFRSKRIQAVEVLANKLFEEFRIDLSEYTKEDVSYELQSR